MFFASVNMTLVSYILIDMAVHMDVIDNFMTKYSHIFGSVESHFWHDSEHYVTIANHILINIYGEI